MKTFETRIEAIAALKARNIVLREEDDIIDLLPASIDFDTRTDDKSEVVTLTFDTAYRPEGSKFSYKDRGQPIFEHVHKNDFVASASLLVEIIDADLHPIKSPDPRIVNAILWGTIMRDHKSDAPFTKWKEWSKIAIIVNSNKNVVAVFKNESGLYEVFAYSRKTESYTWDCIHALKSGVTEGAMNWIKKTCG